MTQLDLRTRQDRQRTDRFLLACTIAGIIGGTLALVLFLAVVADSARTLLGAP